MMELEVLIESVLFWRGEPLTIKELGQIFQTTPVAVAEALGRLEQNLAGRGLVLVKKDQAVMLGTRPEAGELIQRLTKEELAKELGRAGLETIAIVLYQGPITRAEIDYIRGVNSTFILRHLLVRGLVERIPDPQDQRRFRYSPTFDLLRHLGVSQAAELPDYQTLRQEIKERHVD